MPFNRRQLVSGIVAATAFPAMTCKVSAAEAEPYPSRVVKIVCPFAAGGSGDITARLFAEYMKSIVGQTVVVENRAGANGSIGAAAVKSADPDGHTLLLATNSVLIGNELLYKSLPYDPRADLATVGIFGSLGIYMLVTPDAPYKTLSEFVTYAKANPGKTLSPYFNTSSRIASSIFAARAGLEFVDVPYKDVGQALTDLLAGRVNVIFMDALAANQHIQAGTVKPLAITTPARNPGAPDVPALTETYPGLQVFSFLALSLPSKAPAAVQDKLNGLVNDMIANRPIRERLEQVGLSMMPMNLKDVGQFIADERKRWTEYVQIAGLQKE